MQTVTGVTTVSEKVEAQLQHQGLPDGRSVAVVFLYAVNNTASGVYSLQPFFDEKVCYIYPLPIGRGYRPLVYSDALEEVWCQQAAPCMSAYDTSTYTGMSKAVDGTPCQLWTAGTAGTAGSNGDTDTTSFCVTPEGALLKVDRVYQGGNIGIVAHTHFANYTANVPDSAFDHPAVSTCVDLRTAHGADGAAGEDSAKTLTVNDAGLVAKANEEAAGHWEAAPSAVFEGMTLEAASARLGLLGGAGFRLAPPSAGHLDAVEARLVRDYDGGMSSPTGAGGGSRVLPTAFDARTEWGNVCSSIMSVRNQGDCGGCWAFSAAEALADRFCVAAAGKDRTINAYSNLTLSPQWILDCNRVNNGCGGGLLDDAWEFMVKTGVVAETCDPYMYCAHPVSPSCETGVHPPRPTPGQHACPSTCNTTAEAEVAGVAASPAFAKAPGFNHFKASSAYAASKVGDVVGLQREIMAHGPVQVSVRERWGGGMSRDERL